MSIRVPGVQPGRACSLAGAVLVFAVMLAQADSPHDDAYDCPDSTVPPHIATRIDDAHAQAFGTCLACTGSADAAECRFRSGLSPFDLDVCKLLFCTAIEMPGTVIWPEDITGSGTFRFRYAIGTDGRMQDIEIDNIAGTYSEAEARKIIEATYSRRRYAPIEIDGRRYVLRGLVDGLRSSSSASFREH